VLRLPFALYPYQVDFVGRLVAQPSSILAADVGLGKTVMAIAAAEILLQDGVVDRVLVGAEKVKVVDWVTDIGRFTDRSVTLYGGSAARRRQMCSELGDFVVGTYETLRNDIAIKTPVTANKRGWSWSDGPLLEALCGSAVLVLRDEGAAKMGATRSSHMFQAFQRLGQRLAATGSVRMVEISATPMDRDPEGMRNVGSLIAPDLVGNVSFFYEHYVAAWDRFNKFKPVRFKNLSPADCEPGVTPLSELLGPILMTKRKTDPDVVALFPEMPPMEITPVVLSEVEQGLYRDIVRTFSETASDTELFTLMRQVVGHPRALESSSAPTASAVVEVFGERLAKAPTTKLDALVARVLSQSRQGSSSVVYTFFGQSVLPWIAERLRSEGLSVVVNHGGVSMGDRQRAMEAFEAGDAQVFLSSDAGARGINLGRGEYIEQYDLPLTDSISYQRLGRISRLGGSHSVVFANALVVMGTIEEQVADIFLRRKEWAEETIGPSGGLSAEQMRRVLSVERERFGVAPPVGSARG